MYNGNKINLLLKAGNLKAQDLLEAIGIKGSNGSIAQLVNGNPTAKRIEAIADFFQVPIDAFFERKKTVQNYTFSENSVNASNPDIELLNLLLLEKDKRIELLERMNSLLITEIERNTNGQNSDS